MSGKLDIELAPQQFDFTATASQFPLFVGGYGCVSASTRIWTESGLIPISDIKSPVRVLSWSAKDQKFQLSLSGGAFPKGKGKMYQVSTKHGEFEAIGRHQVFSSDHIYRQVTELSAHFSRANFLSLKQILNVSCQWLSSLSVPRYSQTIEDSMGRYAESARRYGQQFLSAKENDQVSLPSLSYAPALSLCFCLPLSWTMGVQEVLKQSHTHRGLFSSLFCMIRSVLQKLSPEFSAVSQISASHLAHIFGYHSKELQSAVMSIRHCKTVKHSSACHSLRSPFCKVKLTNTRILQVTEGEHKVYYDMQVLDTNNYVCENGFIHHNSGKSHAAICRLIALKLKYQAQNVAYYLPTYDLISTIGFPRFSEMLAYMQIPHTLNKSDKTITIGKGQIIFRTMDNPERIIGYEVADSCIDELDTLPTEKARNVWNKIIARNRQKKRDGSPNTIGVATTPEGFRFVHEMWVKNPKPGYEVIRASTESNAKNLPAGYIDSLKAIYPDQLLSAYLDGNFVNLTSGTVYRDFDRYRCNSVETIKEKEPLFIGQDFNVGAMASVVFVQRPDGHHAVSELVGVYDTPELVRILNERYEGHKLFIYPDASGGSRKTVDASLSDITLLQQAGFSIRANKSNPAVKDRINSVNIAFSKSLMWVNATSCPHVAASLEQQAYGKNGEPDKSSGHDHLCDSFGYVAAQEYPVRKPITSCPITFTM